MFFETSTGEFSTTITLKNFDTSIVLIFHKFLELSEDIKKNQICILRDEVKWTKSIHQ